MSKSTTVITKKRKGPAPTGKGVLVGVRLQPDLLDHLDKFITDHENDISRPEAIRLLLKDHLIGLGYINND